MEMFFWRRKRKGAGISRSVPHRYSDKLAPITVRIFVEERKSRPGIWDITLEIINNTEQTKRWSEVLNVDGEILEIPLGVRLIDKSRILISNIVLQPKQKLRLGGIVVLSPHVPRVSVEAMPRVILADEGRKLRISVEKMVNPFEGGLFEVKIQIINESQSAVSQLPFKDRISNTFEVDRMSIDPTARCY